MITTAGFPPPLASRSGLTPRVPAEATVPVLARSGPTFDVRPPRPNLLLAGVGVGVGVALGDAVGVGVAVGVGDALAVPPPASDDAPAPPATTVTGTGV